MVRIWNLSNVLKKDHFCPHDLSSISLLQISFQFLLLLCRPLNTGHVEASYPEELKFLKILGLLDQKPIIVWKLYEIIFNALLVDQLLYVGVIRKQTSKFFFPLYPKIIVPILVIVFITKLRVFHFWDCFSTHQLTHP